MFKAPELQVILLLKVIGLLVFAGLSFFAYYLLIWLGINKFFNSKIYFPVISALVASAGGAFYVWTEVYLSRKTVVRHEDHKPENTTAAG